MLAFYSCFCLPIVLKLISAHPIPVCGEPFSHILLYTVLVYFQKPSMAVSIYLQYCWIIAAINHGKSTVQKDELSIGQRNDLSDESLWGYIANM